MGTSQLKYTGLTPGADANTYNFYDTTLGPGGGFLAQIGARWLALDLKNAAAGTLKLYKSQDRGANWSQIEQLAVPAVAATESNRFEFHVEPYRDLKLDWLNGGSSQAATWLVDLCLSDRDARRWPLPDPTTFQAVGTLATANLKAVAGRVLSLKATNRNAAVRYLQLFNSTGSTATVFDQWLIPAASMIVLGQDFFTDSGWLLSTGITWGVSTTAGSYVAATASETDVSGAYR